MISVSSPHAVIASYRREQHSIVIDFDQQVSIEIHLQNSVCGQIKD